jgi:AcrR family transcriptional regulator
MLQTINTEQQILDAAEKIFIEKGYSGTRTTEIAKVAGVNHAMLHYYFRTKENLFNKIFEQKATVLLGFFSLAFDGDYPFFEKIKRVVETHFDFLSKNLKLPVFILREIVADKTRKDFLLKRMFPIGKELFDKVEKEIQEEIKKGTIKPIKAQDFILNVAALNVFTFVAAQAIFDMENENLTQFLQERKENNIRFIIDSLKI